MKFYSLIFILYAIIGCRSNSNTRNSSMPDSSSHSTISIRVGDSTHSIKTIPVYVKYNYKNKGRITFDSTFNVINDVDRFKYEVLTGFFYKDYEISVLSKCLKDTMPEMFIPLCQEQTITVSYRNKIIKKFNYDVQYTIQKNKNGKKIRMLENVMINIGIIKGKYGEIIVVEGYGGCSSCTEYYGYYSLGGETIGVNYSSKYKTIKNTININRLIKKYGLNYDELSGTDYSHLSLQIPCSYCQ